MLDKTILFGYAVINDSFTINRILEENQCVSKKTMKINGSDLIAMGVKPGPGLGDILDQIYEQVLDDPELNDNEKLKGLANKIITSFI